MKNIIFAFLLLLPVTLVNQNKQVEESVYPLSLCQILGACKPPKDLNLGAV